MNFSKIKGIGDFFKKSILSSVITLIMITFVTIFSATNSYTMGGKTNPSIDTLANELATSNNLDKEYTAGAPELKPKENVTVKHSEIKKTLKKFYLGNINVPGAKQFITEGNNYIDTKDYYKALKKFDIAAWKLMVAKQYDASAKLYKLMAHVYIALIKDPLFHSLHYNSKALVDLHYYAAYSYTHAKDFKLAGDVYKGLGDYHAELMEKNANFPDLIWSHYKYGGEAYEKAGDLYSKDLNHEDAAEMYKLTADLYALAKFPPKYANKAKFNMTKEYLSSMKLSKELIAEGNQHLKYKNYASALKTFSAALNKLNKLLLSTLLKEEDKNLITVVKDKLDMVQKLIQNQN